jgi:iron(III) transport system substrate-binding protein
MNPQDPKEPRRETWRDWVKQALSAAGGVWLWPLSVAVIAILSGMFLQLLNKLRQPARIPTVIAYIAQDQIFAEPLLFEFTQETGISVRTVFDSEAVKTVGLANRLLAERAHPRCDVFWGNEELRTRQLAAQGVWRETNGWAAFGHRSRRIMVNTNFVRWDPARWGESRWGETPSSPDPLQSVSPAEARQSLAPPPRYLADLTNSVWRGRVALAYPLFGTTATHFLALRQHWGEARWEAWCRALAANKPLVVDGNSVVARLVAKGEAWLGLTDSDDIAVVQREGAPVVALPLTDEDLLIPNTVAVVRGAPHPEAAEKLFAWLQRPEVVARLVTAGALEGAEITVPGVKTLQPDWPRLVAELEAGTTRLKEIFLR